MVEVTVLTRNLYLGASIDPIVASANVQHLPRAVAEAWARIEASRFPERAAALADEVAEHEPHLVGLQEAWAFSVLPQGEAGAAAQPVAQLDYLAIFMEELVRRGLEYTVTQATAGPEFRVPSATRHLIHAQDRDVILCRADVEVVDTAGATYSEIAVIRLSGDGNLALPSRRAWARVRVAVEGHALCLYTTHLETPAFPAVQTAQARELADLVRAEAGPTVAVGDFNSGPGEPHLDPYEQLLAAGLTDAWDRARAGEAGPTCCQDEDLRNAPSRLRARIDLVLTWAGPSGGRVQCRRIARVGCDPACRTPSGLWPSDHAGVVAVLDLGAADRASARPPHERSST